jgi:hypothetical protein
MKRTAVDESDLRRELAHVSERHPRLQDDEVFILWFLRAYVTEDEQLAARSLTGGAGDKGLDAVLIDEKDKFAILVQGKFRHRLSAKSEHRGDVIGFAGIAGVVCGPKEQFDSFCKGMREEAAARLAEVRDRVKARHYRLRLKYVTLGRCSDLLLGEAERLVRRADADVDFELVDGRQLLLCLRDYLDGVAPPVPSLDLEMETGTSGTPLLRRFDAETNIESWVFSMQGDVVGELFRKTGPSIFARNVRGFLGMTDINRGMDETIDREPDYFWYYNNGITVVCDKAEAKGSQGRDVLRVSNPQIINGQQTTRTLAAAGQRAAKASVLVRVISVPRDPHEDTETFEGLVSRIVAATNWQNAIRPSDLMANDRRQIEIERSLGKHNYYYLRKRMKKGEARRAMGGRRWTIIRKDELAQAVAACEFDSSVLRTEGKEGLFDERWYGRIFPNSDPFYYLTRYWLMRDVSYHARGYPNRAYAKWLVLHFMWAHVAPSVRARAFAEVMVADSTTGGPATHRLDQAIEIVFNAALAFYRETRGKGPTAKDISTFFRKKGLDSEFSAFWRRGGSSRLRFRKAMTQYAAELRAAVDG